MWEERRLKRKIFLDRSIMAVHPYFQAIADTPSIGKSTKKLYIRNLTYLVEKTQRPLEELIRRPRSTFQIIQREYENVKTRKTLIIAIKAIFKYVPELRCSEERAWKKWHDYFIRLDHQITTALRSGEPTSRERHNWVPWANVVAKEQDLARTEFGSWDHLLLAMYTLIPPARQDYNAVYIVHKKPQEISRGNFIVLPEDTSLPATLYMNNYKTFKAYGTYTRELPLDLTKVIRASLNKHPRRFLFIQENGEPYLKRDSYTHFSNRALERLFGKRFTVTMIRHSFISEGLDFNSATPGELFDAAKDMHHSLAQQQLYRRKMHHLGGVSAPQQQPQLQQQPQAPPQQPPPPPPPRFSPQEYITLNI